MNDWTGFIEKWFNESQIALIDYAFDIMKQKLLVEFDELTDDFDRVFKDDPNEIEFSGSYMRVRSDNIRKGLILLHSSSANPKPNKNTRKNKTRKSVKQRRLLLNSEIPPSTVEKEGSKSFEDVIVSDENIKVVLQLPVNNKRESIQIIAYSDNSVSISYLNSEGKRSSRTSALPYNIDIETARSTFRNGILEITFNRN